MIAPRPCRLQRLIQSLLLVVCACDHSLLQLSHAYSTSSTPHRRQPLMASSSSSDGSMARRAFFKRGTAAAAALTFTTFASTPAHAASSPIPALNSPAPDFSLINTRGQTITLDSLVTPTSASDSSNNNVPWTVLYFYPGAFTSGCTLEARKFQEDLPLFRETNAQIVGVSVDSVEKNSEFCISEGLDFFMLTDQGGKVSKAYGSALSIPGFGTFSNRQTYIIDPQKNVRWVFTDVESRIPRHSGDVLEKLKELQKLQA